MVKKTENLSPIKDLVENYILNGEPFGATDVKEQLFPQEEIAVKTGLTAQQSNIDGNPETGRYIIIIHGLDLQQKRYVYVGLHGNVKSRSKTYEKENLADWVEEKKWLAIFILDGINTAKPLRRWAKT